MTSSEFWQQKLARVQRIWEKYGDTLRKNKELKELLSAYLEAFSHTEEVYQKTGLSSYCAQCGRTGKGSCCGEDMEFSCEDVLLLANLFAGVSFPSKRLFPRGCFFLGPQGCFLKVRPLICRNFVCPELASYLGLEKTKIIQEALGPEAEMLFKLCEHLRRLVPEI